MTAFVPEGMNVLTPYLVCDGATAAIEWYGRAFGAEVVHSLADNDGRVMNATIRVFGATVMLMDEYKDYGALAPTSLNGSPVTIHIFVPDVDAAFARAVEAGATVAMPVADQFWGDRYGALKDPFGHSWSLATHKQRLTPEQIRENMRKLGPAG
jgi:uncharacterized glyoxalase superfamily protein PhnB